MFDEDPERRIVPRWRDSLTTVATGELTPHLGRESLQSPSTDFLKPKIEDWRRHKTVAFAADLIGSAIVLRREGEARDAAEFLLSAPESASSAAIRLARHVLGSLSGMEEDVAAISRTETYDIASIRRTIHQVRSRLNNDPRNAVAWIDIARYYSILGVREQALRAIRRALALAPDNRFVLRSSTRFFVHVGEPDLAQRVLQKTERTRSDPWLLAAEIAASTVAGRTSKFVKQGRSLLSKLAPFHITELASAIATLELNAGNNRGAVKLFRQSLEQPTDNSVAQVEWASRKIGSLQVEERHLELPLSYEARSWAFFLDNKWAEAYEECTRWLHDEPFSSRPAIHGSFIASVTLEDFNRSEQLARSGLKANPENQTLLNNLVFALVSANKLREAIDIFRAQDAAQCNESEKITWLATGGLLSFRQGRPAEGRQLYQQAIELATKDPFRKALAAIFLSREEIRARSSQSRKAYESAVEATKDVRIRSVLGVLNSLLSKTKQALESVPDH